MSNPRSAARLSKPVILLLACAVGRRAAAQTIFADDFESGTSSWTTSGSWHAQDAAQPCSTDLLPFPSGQRCAAFFDPATCDFSTSQGPPGFLTLATSVAVPTGSPWTVLRYRRYNDSEHCAKGYDIALVQVSTNGGASWSNSSSDCRAPEVFPPTYGVPWRNARVALQQFAGQSIDLRFAFWPGDSWQNGGRGWWIDDVEIVAEPGTPSCVASSAICPCGNQIGGYTGTAEDYGGCLNSRLGEAELYGRGTASVSSDTLVLRVADLVPGSFAIYVQGTAAQSTPFGEGRLCVGGARQRIGVHRMPAIVDQIPAPGEVSISARGGVPPAGGTRQYQVVYRDTPSLCDGTTTLHTSNAYRIEWAP